MFGVSLIVRFFEVSQFLGKRIQSWLGWGRRVHRLSAYAQSKSQNQACQNVTARKTKQPFHGADPFERGESIEATEFMQTSCQSPGVLSLDLT